VCGTQNADGTRAQARSFYVGGRQTAGDGGGHLGTLRGMDLRIGVTQSPRELSIDLADDTDRDELKAKIEAALTGAVDVLWLTDKKDRQIAVAAAKIAYVEVGSAEGERKIGFGG
jgi:hypothetical protein